MRGATNSLPVRDWEQYISRMEVLHLLRVGQHVDLLARLEEVRTRMPHDMELLKSVRILRQYVVRQTLPPPLAA